MTDANGDPTSHINTHKIRCPKLSIRMSRLVEPANNLIRNGCGPQLFSCRVKSLKVGKFPKVKKDRGQGNSLI
jgi:hypothetical protein